MLEYATRTVPDILKKAVLSFYSSNEFMKRLQASGRVKRSGGTKVRIPRIKGKHSNITKITGSNLQVNLSKGNTFGELEGNWGKFIKPIILPHQDRDRHNNKEDMKAWVDDTTQAVVVSFRNDTEQQIFLGDMTEVNSISTLNGNTTGLPELGFENGALQFQSPTAQAAAAGTYLGQARLNDTTNFVDNWHNQYKAHTGIGTDCLEAVEEAKAYADSYSQEGVIDCGILSISDHILLSKEIRSSPSGGGQSAIIYTAADAQAGRIAQPILQAGGVQYYPNRWMTAARLGSTGGIFLLNAHAAKWWVNANNDFRSSPFFDALQTMAMDADVGLVTLEAQFAVENLLAMACVSQ